MSNSSPSLETPPSPSPTSTPSILSSTSNNATHLFTSFKSHTSGQRVDTKTAALTLLRESYPSHHITEVNQRTASLFDFAHAGQASFKLDASSDANATRIWTAVGEGIEKRRSDGEVKDDWRFARFEYTWGKNVYIVYYLTWQDTFSSPTRIFYVLSPRETSTFDAENHCVETDALILAAGKWTSQLHDEIFVFDDGSWEKSRELYTSVSQSSWSDVILDPEMKKSLIEDVQGFFDNEAVYAEYSVPWKRGVILHGVPGNGKTASIRALISSLYTRDEAIPSLYVKSFETNCNTAQYSISTIFAKARATAPCLLVFEDLDSLVNDDVRSYFLNEVDGLESNDGILMIGSTNHLDKLDPAIAKRPSRFDRKYHFKIPGHEERRLYAEYWRNKLVKNGNVEFPEDLAGIIASLTEGFSFAYLKELFVMALLSLVRGFKGEDFEMVEKDEAASADGDDDACAKKDGDKKEEEVCTCKPSCAKCNKPLPAKDKEADKKADEAKEADEEVKKNKLVMPDVDVPEHLQDNLLLKVIKYHIRILHADMDNSEDESGGKKDGKGTDGGPGARLARLRRGRRGGCC